MRAREFIGEDASIGATVSGAMAPVAQAMGGPVRRLGFQQPAKYANSVVSVKKRKKHAQG